MSEIRLQGNYALLDCFLDLLLNFLYIMAFLFQGFPEGGKEPFRPLIILKKIFLRRLVVLGLLVERKVSKVHEHVFHVLRIWLPIVLGAKTSEALIAKISLDGVKPLDQNVQTEIEFLFVY